MAQVANSVWWGKFSFEVGQSRHWRVGTCEFAVVRQSQDWRIAYRHTDMEWEAETDALSVDGETLEIFADWARFLSRETENQLVLTPRTMDRPLISRPEHPFQLRPRQEVTIYVSSPVNVVIEADGDSNPLVEFPAVRLSDTWFGPSTREGELCYAAKTMARTALDAAKRQTHRATTALKIVNRAAEPLLVEKISIPLPLLGIYDAQGDLWTNQLSMIRETDDAFAELEIGSRPPAEAGDCRSLAKPRIDSERSLLVRAFGSLFSGGDR